MAYKSSNYAQMLATVVAGPVGLTMLAAGALAGQTQENVDASFKATEGVAHAIAPAIYPVVRAITGMQARMDALRGSKGE